MRKKGLAGDNGLKSASPRVKIEGEHVRGKKLGRSGAPDRESASNGGRCLRKSVGWPISSVGILYNASRTTRGITSHLNEAQNVVSTRLNKYQRSLTSGLTAQ
jgi:hypothetical protein